MGALWKLTCWNSLSTTRLKNLSGTLLTAGQVAQGPALKALCQAFYNSVIIPAIRSLSLLSASSLFSRLVYSVCLPDTEQNGNWQIGLKYPLTITLHIQCFEIQSSLLESSRLITNGIKYEICIHTTIQMLQLLFKIL